MTTNYKGAIDEIFAAFLAAWNAGTVALVGYVPYVQYQGQSDDNPPDASKFWVRISTQCIDGSQATLSENVVVNGSKRFETIGLVFLQIFAPKRSEAQAKAFNLAQLVLNTFRNKTANVNLRNARIKELPYENGACRINVIAEFEFDEIN